MASNCCTCFEEFNEKHNKIPKVLNCGHKICCTCFERLWKSQTQRTCPMCREPLTKKAPEMYSNNCTLRKVNFVIKKNPNSLESYDSFIESSLKYCKRALLAREFCMQSLGNKTHLDLIATCRENVAQALKQDPIMQNSIVATKLISKLQTYFEKIDEILFSYTSSKSVNVSLDNYHKPSFFLYDIANRLHKGKTIYASHTVNSSSTYGKLSLRDCMISVNSFTSSLTDKDESLVSFQDIRKCIKSGNFCTFIEIETLVFNFSIINSSCLALQFIKLCSGETGATFAGVTANACPQFKSDEYIAIENCMVNGVETKIVSDYDMNMFSADDDLATTAECSEGEVVVQMLTEGTCEIRRCSQNLKLTNVVAKLIAPINVSFYKFNPPVVIKSCGISLKLPE